jgi:drug/metabolite transporter (DMT)-like permease
MNLFLGLTAVSGASALYSVRVVLQAAEARAAPEEQTLRVSLLRRLVTRPRWLLGTALGLLGWACQAVALLFAPLTLVQPALAATLVFLLAIGAYHLNERVGAAEVAGVLTIAAAVVLLSWAAPNHTSDHGTGARLWIALAVLGAAALLPYALRARARWTLLVPLSAGLAYSWDGLATKFASDDYSNRAWLGLAVWFLAMNAAAGVGTLSEMSTLQRRPVTQVAPLIFALTTFVPVALAPALAGESWSQTPARDAALVVALALTGLGATILARSAPVVRVLAADRSSVETETLRSPAPASDPATRISPRRATSAP